MSLFTFCTLATGAPRVEVRIEVRKMRAEKCMVNSGGRIDLEARSWVNLSDLGGAAYALYLKEKVLKSLD